MEKNKSLQHQTGAPRKPYCGPELSLYGDVTQITRSGSGSGTDGGAPTMSKQCWIAEALYGVDAPRTLLVRAWLTERYDRCDVWALALVPLYRRFGQRVAAQVRRHSSLQRLFRPLFDHAVRQAHREYASRATLAA
jgi:hypothetical protein